MESIRIEKTQKTPLFILKDGYIQISGRSIPQNSKELYKVCLNWVEQYVKSPDPETKIVLYYEYIDTSSTRCLMDILMIISKIPQNSQNKIVINWYYEQGDHDLHDLGTHIEAHLNVPFNIISLDEGNEIPEI